VSIADDEVRRIFGRYGTLEDVDIKRPPPDSGNAYAFIRYENLDMAHQAKISLSGQYIGKFMCKVGYGKPVPTVKIWVGGLGEACTRELLEKEFDRFGAIKSVDYENGQPCANITFDSIDAAKAAVAEMRGVPLGGPTNRIRIDFAHVPGQSDPGKPPPPGRPGSPGSEVRSSPTWGLVPLNSSVEALWRSHKSQFMSRPSYFSHFFGLGCNRLIFAPVLLLDYRCEEGRFPMFVSHVTISNKDFLFFLAGNHWLMLG
jgi:RNA recognition motif-containing protein